MPVDKFGRYTRKRSGLGGGAAGVRISGFGLTSEGDLDATRKRICRLGEPQEQDDAATKKYVLDRVKEVSCEDAIDKTQKFYTDRIDPAMIQINNDLAALRPLVASYTQGKIPSLEQIDVKFREKTLEFTGTLNDTATLILGDLPRRVQLLERRARVDDDVR